MMITQAVGQVQKLWGVHKKKIGVCVVGGALLYGTSVGAHMLFQVKGTVTGVGETSVTVADFFRTQTVSLAGAPVDMSKIHVGDQIKIKKNLQGAVLSVRSEREDNEEHGKHDGEEKLGMVDRHDGQARKTGNTQEIHDRR